MIQVGSVYTISRAQVKNANKKFSQLNNDYEMTLSRETQVEEGDDNGMLLAMSSATIKYLLTDTSCPQASFNIIKLKDLEPLEENSLVDVAAVIRSFGEAQTFTAQKTQKEYTKRDLSLVDESESEIKLTIWGQDATRFEHTEGTPVIVKGAKVSTFNGKSLSASIGCTILMDPKMPVATRLRGKFEPRWISCVIMNAIVDWYERVKHNLTFNSLSLARSDSNAPFKTLFQGYFECRNSGKPVFFNVKATLILLCE